MRPRLETALARIHVSTLVSLPKASTIEGEYAAAFVMGGMIFEIPRGPTEIVRQTHRRLGFSHGSRPWVMVQPWCSRAHWMMGVRADSTMAIPRLTVVLAVSVMAIVESARLGFSSVMAI